MPPTLRDRKKKTMQKSEVEDMFLALLKPIQSMFENQTSRQIAILENQDKILAEHRDLLETQDKLLAEQNHEIQILRSKVCDNEHTIRYFQHLQRLGARKMENLKQYTRRQNIRVSGIRVEQNESPVHLMSIIQKKCREMGLKLQVSDFDRAHRIGKRSYKNNVLTQQIIVRMTSWKARNSIYEARKKSNLKWFADLTKERDATLNFARDQAKSMRFIDFVFCDRNCTLMVRSTAGKFYAFSNNIEFMSLASLIESGFDQEERYEKSMPTTWSPRKRKFTTNKMTMQITMQMTMLMPMLMMF